MSSADKFDYFAEELEDANKRLRKMTKSVYKSRSRQLPKGFVHAKKAVDALENTLERLSDVKKPSRRSMRRSSAIKGGKKSNKKANKSRKSRNSRNKSRKSRK